MSTCAETVVGDLLVSASLTYLDWSLALASRPSPEEGAEQATDVGDSGQEHSDLFGALELLAAHNPNLSPPRAARELLDVLADNYARMANVRSYGDLDQLRLSPAEEILALWDDEAIHEWLAAVGVEITNPSCDRAGDSPRTRRSRRIADLSNRLTAA